MYSEDIKTYPWLKDIEKNLVKDTLITQEYPKKLDSLKRDEISTMRHEISTLREEIKIIHKVYRDDLNILNEVLVSKNNHIKNLLNQVDLIDDNYNDLFNKYRELDLLKTMLVKSREEWMGKALKFHFLLKEMERVGLNQSEYILDAYKDVEVPIDDIPINIRERYIPTMLTNMVDLESTDDDDEF